MRSDCPLVLPVRDHRAFGTYRLPSLATGTASRSASSLRNVSAGARKTICIAVFESGLLRVNIWAPSDLIARSDGIEKYRETNWLAPKRRTIKAASEI